MSNLTHGMNIDEVRALGENLKARRGEIEGMIQDIQSRIDSAGWQGPDAETFRNDWWPQHKATLQQIAQALEGFGQSAINNASEQETASGR